MKSKFFVTVVRYDKLRRVGKVKKVVEHYIINSDSINNVKKFIEQKFGKSLQDYKISKL